MCGLSSRPYSVTGDKPFGLTFEPSTHPAYQELVQRYDSLPARHPSPDVAVPAGR